jgi:putative peptidoglycan lipid II flippase
MGIMQSYKNFVPSALGSIYYNLSIVGFGVLLSQVFGLGIEGFSISVVIGAVANLAAHIRPMHRVGYKYQPVIDLKQDGIKKFFRMLGPVLLGLSVNHVNLLVNQYFASGLGNSTVSSMKNAQSISQLPVLIFGATISLSIFPTMSEHFATGKKEEYRSDFSMSFRTVFFLTIPAALGIVALRTPLIRAMYLQGEFKVSDIAVMAGFMLIYSIGTIGYSEQLVLNRAFYSVQDTKTPMLINVVCLLLNALLSFIFVRIWDANGLAFAYSAAGIASMVLLSVYLRKRVGALPWREIIVSAVKTVLASGAMLLALFRLDDLLDSVLPIERKVFQLLEVGILFVVGVAVFFIVAILLRMREVEAVKSIFMRKFRKS